VSRNVGNDLADVSCVIMSHDARNMVMPTDCVSGRSSLDRTSDMSSSRTTRTSTKSYAIVQVRPG
jgi:hypothetical protein